MPSGGATNAPPSSSAGTYSLVDDPMSSNHVATGIGEVLQAFAAAPIMIGCDGRTMALERKRVTALTGRVSFRLHYPSLVSADKLSCR